MRAVAALAGTRPDGVVTARWFAFIASWTLRRSARSNDYAAVIRIHASREFAGWSTVDAGLEGLKELVQAMAPVTRDTDLIGELQDGGLGLLVQDADEADCDRLIERISEAIRAFEFSVPLTLAIGFAVCPTHGVDMQALVGRAESHPALNVHTRLQPADPLGGEGAASQKSPLRESAIHQALAVLGLADSSTE